ncbi:MAG: hypothetical protein MZU91_06465 [Desulfosudis oleivorans]|nr:hypothetical protein [Desulfosudis oleivorans]
MFYFLLYKPEQSQETGAGATARATCRRATRSMTDGRALRQDHRAHRPERDHRDRPGGAGQDRAGST